MGAARKMTHASAVSPMLRFHGGCENSIVYLGAAFPGTEATLSCALASELTWGPCSLPLSETVRSLSAVGTPCCEKPECGCVKWNSKWYLGAHQVR